MRDYLATVFAGVFVLVIIGVIAILLMGCGEPLHVVAAPPQEDLAVAIVALTFEEAGEPIVDLQSVSTTWYSNACLASFTVDTEHWAIKPACVHGVALGCTLQMVTPMGAGAVLSRSSLAHEMYHCQGFQAGGVDGLDVEHKRPGWKSVVPLARQRLVEAGL